MACLAVGLQYLSIPFLRRIMARKRISWRSDLSRKAVWWEEALLSG